MELVAATETHPLALVIANACDLLDPDERKFRVDRELAALEDLGFRAKEYDLRRYFPGASEASDKNEPTSPHSALASASLVWARGGNAFVLLRAMRQSGFAGALTSALASNSVVYGGYSGGIAVLPKTLRGLEIVNNPTAVPPGYDPAVPWDGLGILPYSLAPHFKSSHPASPGIDEVVRFFQARKMPFQTLRDGEVSIVSGGYEELVR